MAKTAYRCWARPKTKPKHGFQAPNAENTQTPTPVILPVNCPGVQDHSGTAYTINLPMVVEAWKHVAMRGGKYAQPALELLGLSAVHSLERTYQKPLASTTAARLKIVCSIGPSGLTLAGVSSFSLATFTSICKSYWSHNRTSICKIMLGRACLPSVAREDLPNAQGHQPRRRAWMASVHIFSADD